MSATEVYYYYTDDSPPVLIVAPGITGTAQDGETLTINLGTWEGVDSLVGSLRYVSDDTEVATYTANGTYIIQPADIGEQLYLHVDATGPGGVTSVDSAPTAVIVPDAPVAGFTYVHDAGGSRNVAFTDTSTNTPTAWDWDYGDGSAHGTTQNPTRTYANDGAYTVTLIASNAGGASAPVNHAISVVGYLLQDEFTTNEAAPLASPRACEPIGTLTLIGDASYSSIVSGKLTLTNPPSRSVFWRSDNINRQTGVALVVRGGLAASSDNGIELGYLNSSNTRIFYASPRLGVEFLTYNGDAFNFIIGSALPVTDTEYAVVLTSSGSRLYAKLSGVWVLIWGDAVATTTPVRFAVWGWGTVGGHVCEFQHMRVRTQLPAPFQTDEGIASVNVTSFTQSLGAELLTNGDFANWTADNPDGWTVTGEVASDPMVTQVAPGGGAGTGAARLFASGATSNPILTQSAPPLTIGALYEWAMNVSAYTSGLAIFNNNDAGTFGISASVVGVKEGISRAVNTGVLLRSNTAAHDFVIDSLSVKLITPNAVHTATADAITDLTIPLPASPIAGQRAGVRYRVHAVNPTLDYWELYLIRNAGNTAWDLVLDSVSGGTVTNRSYVAGIGFGAGTTVTIRSIYEGSLHDLYTLSVGAWAKRGAQVNLSHQNTSTGVQAVTSSAIVPTSLKSYPRTAAAYAELDRVRS